MCGYYINIIATSEGQSKSTSIIFWKHHLITNIRQIGETEKKGERKRERVEKMERRKKERQIERKKAGDREKERKDIKKEITQDRKKGKIF